MKEPLSKNSKFRHLGGASFEVLLVIGVVAGLLGTVTAGVVSYRNGQARHECVKNIATVQRAVRLFQTEHHLRPGQEIVKADIIGKGKMLEKEPCCPHTGEAYLWSSRIPLPGRPLVQCLHANVQGHAPSTTADW